MQAYAAAERIQPQTELRALPTIPEPRSIDGTAALGAQIVDELLDRLADRLADRIAAKAVAREQEQKGWLDTRGAADYLGVHRDTVRRLAAEGVIPVQQAGAGCKLYFRRGDLDRWRNCSGASVRPLASNAGTALR